MPRSTASRRSVTLTWSRGRSEVELLADLTTARLILALPKSVRRESDLDQVPTRWICSVELPNARRQSRGAAPRLLMSVPVDHGFLPPDEFDRLDESDDNADFFENAVFDPPLGERVMGDLMTGRFLPGRMTTYLRAVVRDREKLLARLQDRPMQQRLAKVSQQLSLRTSDSMVLQYLALVRADADLRRFVYAVEQATRARFTDLMAVAIGLPAAELEAALLPGANLVRLRLLRARSLESEQLNDNPLGSLLDGLLDADGSGRDPLALVMAPALPSLRVVDDFPHLAIPIPAISAALTSAWRDRRRGVNVLLHGQPGTGKTQIARLLAQSLSAAAFEVPIEDEDGDPRSGEARAKSAVLCQRALSGMERPLLIFDEAEDLFPAPMPGWLMAPRERPQKGWVNRLLEEAPVPTVWIANEVEQLDPAFLRRFELILEVPPPPRAIRRKLIDSLLPDAAISLRWREEMAELDDLAPAELERLARVTEYLPTDTEHLLRQVFEEARRVTGRSAVGQSLLLPANYSLANVNADADLALVAERIHKAGSARLCLYGPPGSGKTAYAQHLSERLDRPLHAKRASDLLAPYVGQTEHNLARVFESAKRDGAVLLIDEVDSFLHDRHRAERSWEVTQVNELLTQMERFPGVLIMCTNRFEQLDAAAMRRFDLKIRFGFLNFDQRLSLLESAAAQLQLAGAALQWEAARARLGRLDRLTPGAFATAARRHELSPLASIVGLVDCLESEQVAA